ncbi:flagellar hook-length control protein FliK [Campylobacter sp. 19-13652]|uniref:flagellar hook-length control protein FliK n=1 Tax=Campylobacter sp. 19-13652 TaxID=2840180 RepID=UPI001C76E102|nr:flagellar hook-length control protein FliK [Campylobacter sp. 19-13652]BCX78592.1 hypothetical protein LBC_00540 [Campylobacter sp. 19-13652]
MQANANALLEIASPQNKGRTKVSKASTGDSSEFLSYIKEATPKEAANRASSQPKSSEKQSQNSSTKNENNSPNTANTNKSASENRSDKSQSSNQTKQSEPTEKTQENSTKFEPSQKANEAKLASDKAITRLEESITKEGAATMLDDANLMQLLAVLDAINAPKELQGGLFPKLGEKLAALLSVPENAAELSEAKSVSDVIKLAQKFDLELKDIKITSEIEQALNEKFPNLAAKDFFKTSEQAVISSGEFLAKTKVDESLKQGKDDKSASLASLLSEALPKEQKSVNLKPESQKILKDEPKSELSTSSQNSQNAEKAPTLRDLIFPEKSAAQASKATGATVQSGALNDSFELLGASDEPKGDITPNTMAKNIVAEAKMQLHNRVAVKETLGNFSSSLAEQVANYKAPVTKVSMTLNPLNLGEVEVVMTTRGNNLHINFTSNTQAMNLFIANQAEFKNSLVNMGFTELSMNFSDQNQRQNQQGGQAPKGRSFFGESDELEQDEQISLELILPKYI